MVQQKQQDPKLSRGFALDILERARVVATRIGEHAPEADRTRDLPAGNMSDLHEAGLLTLTTLGNSAAPKPT